MICPAHPAPDLHRRRAKTIIPRNTNFEFCVSYASTSGCHGTRHTPHACIANELAGSSVFFQPAPAAQRQGELVDEHSDEPLAQQPTATTPPTTAPTKAAALLPGNHATTAPATQPGMAAAIGEFPEPALLEEVRKAVHQLGKEAATHRFTADEKRRLAEIVYTYARQGLRTSENEIACIAVNWILLDYDRLGDQSVLAKLLASLHG